VSAAPRIWVEWLNRLGPVIGLAAVFALFALLKPDTFLTAANLEIIALQTAVVATAASGMTLVIISGGIDLSVGSIIALVTVAVALFVRAGTGPFLAAAGGVAVGAACGLFNGLVITRLQIVPFIVTLGSLGILRGLAKGLANEQMVFTTGAGWLVRLLTMLGEGQRWQLFPPGVWIMLIVAVLVAGLLRYTQLGRHIFAVGSNEQTARLCGVQVERVKLTVYVVGAALAGLAGVLQFSYLNVGDPTTAIGYELNVIAAVVIGGGSLNGGQGSILGSLVGALIMTVIGNGCTKIDLPNWVQEIVTGAIIIVAVALDRFRRRRGV
jgi:ribose transport system permease protein